MGEVYKRLVTLFRLPDRTFVEFSMKSSDPALTITKIAEALARHGAKVVSLNTSSSGEISYAFFIVDYEGDAKALLKGVAEEVKGFGEVESLIYAEPKSIEESKAYKEYFPASTAEEREKIVNEELLAEAMKRLYGLFGSGAAVFFYHLGYTQGYMLGTSHRKEGVKEITEESVKACVDAIRPFILCKIVKVEWDPEKCKGEIVVKDLTECKVYKGGGEEPKSHLFRGFLAGYLSALLNREVKVVEVKCIAKGDEVCEFAIKTRG